VNQYAGPVRRHGVTTQGKKSETNQGSNSVVVEGRPSKAKRIKDGIMRREKGGQDWDYCGKGQKSSHRLNLAPMGLRGLQKEGLQEGDKICCGDEKLQ